MPTRNGEYADLKRDLGQGDIDLMCNECGTVIATVAAADAEATLLRMAMSAGVCSETCPQCGELNVFPGFSAMEAYMCRHCGAGVVVRRPVQ
jgi:hypothetical protein